MPPRPIKPYDTKPVGKESSRTESAFDAADGFHRCAAGRAEAMRDGDLRIAGRAFTRAHTPRGNLFPCVQEPIGLICSGQHPLHFLNQKRVTTTGVINKSLPLLRRALQRRLENFANPTEVFRRYRLSVAIFAHLFDGCAIS
jgi:hypothetical protein